MAVYIRATTNTSASRHAASTGVAYGTSRTPPARQYPQPLQLPRIRGRGGGGGCQDPCPQPRRRRRGQWQRPAGERHLHVPRSPRYHAGRLVWPLPPAAHPPPNSAWWGGGLRRAGTGRRERGRRAPPARRLAAPPPRASFLARAHSKVYPASCPSWRIGSSTSNYMSVAENYSTDRVRVVVRRLLVVHIQFRRQTAAQHSWQKSLEPPCWPSRRTLAAHTDHVGLVTGSASVVPQSHCGRGSD